MTTYVDGIPYFDRDRDKQLRDEDSKERSRLILKMNEVKLKGENVQKPVVKP